MEHTITEDGITAKLDYRHFHMSDRKLYIRHSKLTKYNRSNPIPGNVVVFGKKHTVVFKLNLNRTYRDNNYVKYWQYLYEDSDLMAPGECALYEVHVQDDSVKTNIPFPDGFIPDDQETI
jgi:hypothetical protein